MKARTRIGAVGAGGPSSLALAWIATTLSACVASSSPDQASGGGSSSTEPGAGETSTSGTTQGASAGIGPVPEEAVTTGDGTAADGVTTGDPGVPSPEDTHDTAGGPTDPADPTVGRYAPNLPACEGSELTSVRVDRRVAVPSQDKLHGLMHCSLGSLSRVAPTVRCLKPLPLDGPAAPGVCVTDMDCRADQACICGSYYGPPPADNEPATGVGWGCVPAHCPDECNGYPCGLSRKGNELRGLWCHGPNDLCQYDQDCADEATPSVCEYDEARSLWACRPKGT